MVKISRKYHILIICSVIFLIFIISTISYRIHSSRGCDAAVGTYITSSGDGYIVIEKGMLWGLKVKEERLPVFRKYYHDYKHGKTRLSFKNGQLSIQRVELQKPGDSTFTHTLNIHLIESKTSTGKWDLVNAEVKESGRDHFVICPIDSFEDVVDNFRNVIFHTFLRNKLFNYDLSYIPKISEFPVRSYLHKVNNPNISEYFNSRYMGKPVNYSLNLIRNITKENPDDPYLQLHLIELEALSGNLIKAEKLIKTWKSFNRDPKNKIINHSVKCVSNTVEMETLRKKFPDSYLLKKLSNRGRDTEFITTGTNLNTEIEWCKMFLDEYKLLSLPTPLINPDNNTDSPDCYSLIEYSKVLRTIATFNLFEGKRKESLKLYASIYIIGESISTSVDSGYSSDGYYIKAIALSGLQLYLLNACETKKELFDFLSIIKKIKKIPYFFDAEDITNSSYAPLFMILKNSSSEFKSNLEFIKNKYQSYEMWLNLLQMTAAAKLHFLETGNYPDSYKDFEKYFPSGIPKDAFDKNSFIRFIQKEGSYTVYSIGPDKMDNKTNHCYNTNWKGDFNSDIIIEIPQERKFPFPEDGVKANSACDLLKQFPNGLPVDLFCNYNSSPLTILESPQDHSVAIFSYGPDKDENSDLYFNSGFTSNAPPGMHVNDYMKDLSFGGTANNNRKYLPAGPILPSLPPPVPTPSPEKDLFRMTSYQKVLWRSNDKLHPRGYRMLSEYYDPTNGIDSTGDLFIEIPCK
jgi:hypothetical protein